ncbi:hypothetical protein [Corynebacterium heidelbergense]|uniref:Uncharacterized protein n=1 Tax=Corynebacterium heidelbergense TaxID=2055947 RepID=A0A364V3T4_9CORY|nr:hypothetical protein [Corynebacterium heidelbergense]RAV31305.1 hypothetical protein DLJ54_09060 [Corynebacterium heidelbergense]
MDFSLTPPIDVPDVITEKTDLSFLDNPDWRPDPVVGGVQGYLKSGLGTDRALIRLSMDKHGGLLDIEYAFTFEERVGHEYCQISLVCLPETFMERFSDLGLDYTIVERNASRTTIDVDGGRSCLCWESDGGFALLWRTDRGLEFDVEEELDKARNSEAD